MRTKTLLMSAAALLAAGIVSTQAQVYSQNVVGYASIPTPTGPNYMLTIPFAIGVSNGANEIWPLISPGVPSLPDYSAVLIWNPNTSSYTEYYSDSTSSTLWDDANFTPGIPAPKLPVGEGFFLVPSANVTNVFAGTVAVNLGTSNAISYATGPNYLVGCLVPYAGAVTNGNPTTYAGGPNLSINGGLADYSAMLVWNPATSSYTEYYSDSTSTTLWDDSNFTPNVVNPTISVGQGFFLVPSADFNWKVGL